MPQHHRAARRGAKVADVARAREAASRRRSRRPPRTAASVRGRSRWRAACGRRAPRRGAAPSDPSSAATSRTAPSCMSLMRKRSASKPGRLIASHARSPLRRYTGCVSQAGLSAVRFLGAALPFDGTSYRSKFVDQASSRPATRALNTTRAPSGLNVNSSSPPSGLEGTSASSALLTFTGVPARPSGFTGATNRLERVPLLQVSQ